MKKLFLLALLLPFIACKQARKEAAEVKEEVETIAENAQNEYPEALQKVFDAHGGLAAWKKQRSLSFVVPKPDSPETHTIDLWSRNEKIETPGYTLGFDGKAWVFDANKAYKGNPEFYHNLMFYFYAMPFVLADEGIIYSETDDLVFEGLSYPGIKISYNAGVGTSPKDDYYIHYNAETKQMEWLGYTVTYRSGEKTDKVNWIRYNDWQNIKDLVLPNSISWYTVEEGEIKGLRNQVVFENVDLSNEAKSSDFYEKPQVGEYWVKSAEH
ncbi:DUF6503 family protein [Croceitalea marina]|uniref:DUF6503 family protein n=1 Tax=Croceitalea marina TaxID=1775166 RepID=A0ABW5MR54_9FLAO